MNGFLEQIYHGEFDATFYSNDPLERYSTEKKKWGDLITPFYKTLSDSQKIAFDHMMSIQDDFIAAELEQAFYTGFKAGGRLIHETLSDDSIGRTTPQP